jgi:hypothetical protein
VVQAAIALAIVLASSPLALAADALAVVGIYSSFRSSEQSGDIVGMELHIVPDPTGFSGIVQASEGGPGYPEVVPVAVEASTVRFAILPSSRCGLAPGEYTGSVTGDKLLLSGPDWESPRLLKRGKSFWQR